jgi:hypothetical protein
MRVRTQIENEALCSVNSLAEKAGSQSKAKEGRESYLGSRYNASESE